MQLFARVSFTSRDFAGCDRVKKVHTSTTAVLKQTSWVPPEWAVARTRARTTILRKV